MKPRKYGYGKCVSEASPDKTVISETASSYKCGKDTTPKLGKNNLKRLEIVVLHKWHSFDDRGEDKNQDDQKDGGKILHDEELRYTYSSLNIVRLANKGFD
jgi:hypothetical protein